MGNDTSLTLAEAAALLGVHYQTAYRWIRSGHLRALKVRGIYRVERSELDRVARQRQVPAEPPPPSEARLDRESERMQRALLDGDEATVLKISRRLADQGTSVTALVERVIVPPLVHIGAAWSQGELDIYVEHRATAIVERILGEMTPNPRGRRRGTAVVAALTGDRHGLPTAMATAALREDMWTVQHLGPDMPFAEVRRFVEARRIDLAVISASTKEASAAALVAKETLEADSGVPTLVGGPGQTLKSLQQLARDIK